MANKKKLKAVLPSASDKNGLDSLVLAYTPRFTALLDRAENRIKRSGGVKDKEFWEATKKKR